MTEKTVCSAQINHHFALNFFAGVACGLLILAVVANFTGIASNLFELANVLVLCLIASATLFVSAQNLD